MHDECGVYRCRHGGVYEGNGMSGILLAFFSVPGAAGPVAVVSDGSFSGAPLSDVSFGG